MGQTFAEKFEEALAERRESEPGYGLRTLARKLAKDDPEKIETIRRRLNKYRPKPSNGGAAQVAPTASTRREIEEAMGLEHDSLAPDQDLVTAASSEAAFLNALRPLARLFAERDERDTNLKEPVA